MDQLKCLVWDNKEIHKVGFDGEEDYIFQLDRDGWYLLRDSYKDVIASSLDNHKLMRYAGFLDKHGNAAFEDQIVKYTKVIYTDCSRTEIEEILEPVVGKVYYAEGLWLGLEYADGTGSLFRPGQIAGDEINKEFEILGDIYSNSDLWKVVRASFP